MWNIFEVGKFSAGFYLNLKWLSFVKNYEFEKTIFIAMSPWRHQPPYDTHPRVVISRNKFHIRTPSRYGRVKAYVRTYVRTKKFAF